MTTLRVQHVSEYHYAQTVELAAHMVHLRPRSLPWQRVRQFTLTATPPGAVHWADDHFGNAVAWLSIETAHPDFRIAIDAVVDVEPPALPDPARVPAWEVVAAAALATPAARDVAEFTFASPMVPPDAAALAYAAESFAPGRPVLAAVTDLMTRINLDFRFDATATSISTPVARVMELRAGVCQDFAHVMIAGLRGLGLPARYVSGYLRTRPPPGQPRMVGADVSHAWVSAWLGPEHGWIGLDPTNDVVVTDGHVWLGWGRDYADVSPVRGILMGGGRHSMRVSVDIEAVSPAE